MNAVLVSTLNPFVMSLGLALVNFVWQGALIGLVTAALLQLLGNARPQNRYAVACGALMLCLFLPLQALIAHSIDGPASRLFTDSIGPMNADPRAPTSLFWFWSWVQSNMMKLVLAWSVCVVFFSARLTIGLAWVARIAGPNQSSANPYWQGQLNQLTQRCGMQKKVILRVVNNLDSPAVAGWLRPVILVPGTLITGMPPELLEALLAHEVAHIRRMDYSINLLQSGVEILLFYHPAVWWISKQIRIEREQIADDLAAQIIGEPRRLALALSELERVQFAGNQLALAANGGNLVKRIKRLTQPGIQPAGFKAIAPLITIIFAGIAFYANAATDTNTPPVVQVKSTKAIVDLRTCAKPNYPAQSLVNKDQGTVRMSFSIDLTGHVTSSTVEQTSGHPELDEAAIVALNKCSFTPGTINGKAVVSATNVDYIWKLPN